MLLVQRTMPERDHRKYSTNNKQTGVLYAEAVGQERHDVMSCVIRPPILASVDTCPPLHLLHCRKRHGIGFLFISKLISDTKHRHKKLFDITSVVLYNISLGNPAAL
jgi:hypothetical protein